MPEIAPWAFVLAVPDFKRTASYFRDVLGFRILWGKRQTGGWWSGMVFASCWGTAPTRRCLPKTGPHNWLGYLSVSDVDALHAELTERGAQCSAPTDTAYGMREVTVTTIDGHRIVFGQDNDPGICPST